MLKCYTCSRTMRGSLISNRTVDCCDARVVELPESLGFFDEFLFQTRLIQSFSLRVAPVSPSSEVPAQNRRVFRQSSHRFEKYVVSLRVTTALIYDRQALYGLPYGTVYHTRSLHASGTIATHHQPMSRVHFLKLT